MKILWILLVLSLWGCSSGVDRDVHVERSIQAFLAEAKVLEKNKDYVGACAVYKKLMDVGDQELLKKYRVYGILERRGWTAKKLETSGTVKVLVENQNTINSFLKRMGHFPEFGLDIKTPVDLWGNEIRFKKRYGKKNTKQYNYMLVSRGPDQVFDTDDDLRILNKATELLVIAESKKEKKKKKKNKRGENVMDINVLLKNQTLKSSEKGEG